ncbi:hypothetical protein LTS18_004673 [Coniosporium uncinatum]|uniref:Uncharacterized protein n=1 Tax=Coniosporium uncinatum TaxID=93489 RepID=A0ACC3DRX6_9PEZI|nr:hypothetical protein LTS18_004673 [Coniosporium uncinatum]
MSTTPPMANDEGFSRNELDVAILASLRGDTNATTSTTTPSSATTLQAGENDEQGKDGASGRTARGRAPPKRLIDEVQNPSTTDSHWTKLAKYTKLVEAGEKIEYNDYKPLFTNPHSPLAWVKIGALASIADQWDLFSAEEQKKLVGMLPRFPSHCQKDDGTYQNNEIALYLANSQAFQAECRNWQDDLAAGRFKPTWRKAASEAMKQRARGEMDEWKEKEREPLYGAYSQLTGNDEHNALQIQLKDLIADDLFRVGDTWYYRRQFGKASLHLRVTKELMVSRRSAGSSLDILIIKQVTELKSNRITFRVPEADRVYLTEGGPTIEFAIESPQDLAVFIRKGLTNVDSNEKDFVDAWEEFTVMRKDQNLGMLREIRDKHYLRNLEKYDRGGGSDETEKGRKAKKKRKA